MIHKNQKNIWRTQLTERHLKLQKYIFRLEEIEQNSQMSDKEKLSEIKIIQEKITKVGTEIDKIKKEITLSTNYSFN